MKFIILLNYLEILKQFIIFLLFLKFFRLYESYFAGTGLLLQIFLQKFTCIRPFIFTNLFWSTGLQLFLLHFLRPSGPKSIIWSAVFIKSKLCSITIIEFPPSTSLCKISISLLTSSI